MPCTGVSLRCTDSRFFHLTMLQTYQQPFRSLFWYLACNSSLRRALRGMRFISVSLFLRINCSPCNHECFWFNALVSIPPLLVNTNIISWDQLQHQLGAVPGEPRRRKNISQGDWQKGEKTSKQQKIVRGKTAMSKKEKGSEKGIKKTNTQPVVLSRIASWH